MTIELTSLGIEKIEAAKILKSIKAAASSVAHYDKVATTLFVDAQELSWIERSIAGLSAEDEFAEMCKRMGTVTHIVPLQQTPYIEGDFVIPDFLMRFQPGCKCRAKYAAESNGYICLIDVKTTMKNRVTGSELRKLRNFADCFGIPLVIAARSMRPGADSSWQMIEVKSGSDSSIEIPASYSPNGLRHVLWDEVAHTVRSDVRFRITYDSSISTGDRFLPDFGEVVKIEVFDGAASFTASDEQINLFGAFCECLEPVLETENVNGELTTRVFRPQKTYFLYPDMIFKMNQLFTDKNGLPAYVPTRILMRSMVPDQPQLVDREKLDKVVMWLSCKGFVDVQYLENCDSHFQKWLNYGGRAES